MSLSALDEKMGKVETKILATLHRVEEGEFKTADDKRRELIFANVEANTIANVLDLPENLPAVVYYKNSQPIIYKGSSTFLKLFLSHGLYFYMETRHVLCLFIFLQKMF